MDHSDPIIWDFAWQAVPGATKYQLFVISANAPFPLINNSDLASPSYHHEGRGAYVANQNRFGWRWKVRAMVDGAWTQWSDERTFDVEPLDTDEARQTENKSFEARTPENPPRESK